MLLTQLGVNRARFKPGFLTPEPWFSPHYPAVSYWGGFEAASSSGIPMKGSYAIQVT